ncbi:calpastatin isoform X5 [Gadus morhua]|uniref:calpastatin isoform X5 n=1 Tax=Gadus morhua TaxID=8049 RepID=UPI0011B66731|nr:calpastatin isoform X5 [Gadus morhua]
MPHKKRSHGHHKKSTESQPSQTTPTPAAQVTTVKPSQFETARAAAKRGVAGATSIDMSSPGATIVDMSAPARGSTNTASKTPPVSQVKATAAATPSPPSGAARATMSAGTAASSAQAKPTANEPAKSAAPTAKPPVRDTPKADPAKAAKPAGAVTPAAAAAAAAVGVSGKGKPEVAKPAQKVQVEVAPPRAKAAKEAPALDPFDALASSLPTVGPVKPEPVYTGPEVHEHGVTAEKGVLCGEREDTLPPNYRYENMPTAPDVKPKDVPKPMSTDEALDSLSFGFAPAPSAPPQAPQEKMESVDAIDALSAGFSNFAPPPPASVKSPAPPVDKKAKMDAIPDDFSLMGALSSPPPPQKSAEPKLKVESPAAPVLKEKTSAAPAVKAQAPAVPVAKIQAPAVPVAKIQAPAVPVAKAQAPAVPVAKAQAPAVPVAKVQAAVPKETKVDSFDDFSLDPFAALGDTLGAPEPVHELPELRPEDIVSEAKLTEEEGVRTGVRDDTLPPEYRFSEAKLKDLPAPKPEPSLAPGEALDFLSGDFVTLPAAAPVVQAPVLAPSAPPAQVMVEDLSALDALDALSGDFMTQTKTTSVQAPLPSLAKKTPKVNKDSAKPNTTVKVPSQKPVEDDFSLDPFAALSDTLAAPEPAPEPPKLRPEDIVSEGKVISEKGVRVGERDDTLPPEYRLSGDKLKDLPAPKPEPTMNTGDALDILSGDFLSPSLAPAVQAPVCSLPKPPASADFDALDALAGDFVTNAVVAPAVKCATSQPTQISRQVSEGDTSAMDALSDSLMDITPVPEPAPLPMKDIAKEKKVVEERLILMGEDDSTLPPEYRPTEEDIKMAAAEAKKPKEKPMGDAAALDLLSGDFLQAPSAPAAAVAPAAALAAAAAVAPAAAAAVAPAAAPCFVAPPATQQLVPDTEPLKPMAGSALDSLAGSLLPDAIKTTSKGEKPKKTTGPSLDSSSGNADAPGAKSKGEKAQGKSKSRSKSKKHHADDPSPIDQLAGDFRTDVMSAKKGGKS